MTGKLTVPSFQVTGGSPASGEVLTADSSGNATWGTPAAGAQALAATAVKTSAYNAAAGDFVPVDASGGSVTVTLPTTPVDKTRVGIKMINVASTNTTTIAAGGSDVFNKAGGATTLTLSLLNQGMLLQYASSTGIWYVQSDDLALSQLDGRYNLAGPLDARNYAGTTTGGITTFNLAQMITDAISLNRSVYIPGGKWQPSSYNIALDNNSVDLFTFHIFGDGYESKLVLPPAMTSSDSLFIANSTNSNTFFAHPRLVFERFSAVSALSSNATFLTKHQRSLSLDTVYFSSIQNGIYSDGYSDEDRIVRLYAESMTPGGWAYQHAGEGDAVSIQSCFTYACAGFNITNAKAVQINGLLSGWHSFTESIVDMVNFHIEGDGTTDSDPLIAIQGCNFNFGSGALYGTPYRPCVQIDDSANLRRKSRVTFSREFAFRQRLDAPGSTDGSAQCVAINLPATSGTSNLNEASVINFNSNVCEIFGQTTTTSGSTYEEILPLITSSDSGAGSITNALAAHPPLLGMDVQLRYRNATWEIAAYDPDSAVRTTRHTSAAEFILATAASPAGYGGDGTLVAGTTYYYTHCIYDAELRNTANSAETSATPSSGSPLIELNFNLQFAPSKIRLWRGTTSGTYTSWVEILVSNETPQLVDQGSYIAGQAWSSTGVPATQATNATQDGIVVRGVGHAQIWSAAPPIAGGWNAGDFCWNNAPVIGSPIGWMCTTAGSPGTWTAGPLIPGLGTQTLSSNGAVTINAATGDYQTITLSANATSSTITNSRVGQILVIGWIQDVTGSRTYAWPTACKFAAGAAPSASTTASFTDQVTFVYDGTHWNEIGRAVGIH